MSKPNPILGGVTLSGRKTIISPPFEPDFPPRIRKSIHKVTNSMSGLGCMSPGARAIWSFAVVVLSWAVPPPNSRDRETRAAGRRDDLLHEDGDLT